MNVPRWFYLMAAVVGAVVPWLFFTGFFAQNGLDLPRFVQSLFANGVAGGFTADILISSLVFWVWSYADARQRGVRYWWIIVPANLLVGLSLAMPLYFYLRAGNAVTK